MTDLPLTAILDPYLDTNPQYSLNEQINLELKLHLSLGIEFNLRDQNKLGIKVKGLLSFLRAVSWREEGKDLSEILGGGRKMSDLHG